MKKPALFAAAMAALCILAAPASFAATLTISTTTLPNATVSSAYSTTLAASGGTPPYTWSIATGSLPAGLTLSSAGVISGTPTIAGISTFTVQISDSASNPQVAAAVLGLTVDTKETVLYSFCRQANCADGSSPSSALIQAADGNFYGTTLAGGTAGEGTAFRITPTGALTTLYSFCSQGGTACTDGDQPEGSLIQGIDGNLYGTTSAGGTLGSGTIYQITPSGTLTTIYNFTGGSDGAFPVNGLLQGTDGNLYGTAKAGGTYNQGSIYRLAPAGASSTFATLYSFCPAGGTNCTDGSGPRSVLLQGSDGNLYGTTNGGGTYGYGTIFQITLQGVFTTVWSFCSEANCADGAAPSPAPLIEYNAGIFLGTSTAGGSNNGGIVFVIEPSVSSPYGVFGNFCQTTGCPSGSAPGGRLFFGSDGGVYGTTNTGGTQNDGAIYLLSATGSSTISSIYSFCSASNCSDGDNPSTGLVQAADGDFYGTTGTGGANNAGAIFRYSSSTLAPPVQLMLSASTVAPNSPVTLTWQALNAVSTTMQQCSAFIQNGATTAAAGNWTGLQAGASNGYNSSGSATLTPTLPGTYTYALTCGGIESGFTALTVAAAPTVTTLMASSPATYGTPLTLTATIAPQDMDGASTANVSFYDGATLLGTVASSGFSAVLTNIQLTAGTHNLSASFAGDSTYGASIGNLALAVAPAAPAITWPTPVSISFGTALSATQLNATAAGVSGATLAGTFVYTPASGTVLAAGTQTLSLTFTPTDTTDYTTATRTVTIIVNQAASILSWAAPASIAYGTALSATQLDATAVGLNGPLAGTFAYTPAAGTVLAGGTHTLSVTFTPADTTDYTTATQSTSIAVTQETPRITWANPAPISSGTALSSMQLDAKASGLNGAALAGSFVYTPPAGTVLGDGTQILSVTFTPGSKYGTDYTATTAVVSLVVKPGATTQIAHGTAGQVPHPQGNLPLETQLANVQAAVADSSGNLYISDSTDCLILKVPASGDVTAVAGTGSCGETGDGGAATSADIGYVLSMALDGAGNLYFSDDYYILRKVNLGNGIVSHVAGIFRTPGNTGDGGPAGSAEIGLISGLATDAAGNLYLADGQVVREITASTGIITTVAGIGSNGTLPCTTGVDIFGDGCVATQAVMGPLSIAISGSTLYIGDSYSSTVRAVALAPGNGIISVFAGTAGTPGTTGDGGLATSATLEAPYSITTDTAGDVYFIDGTVVREVAGGTINRIAGEYGASGFSGDGGAATNATLEVGLSSQIALLDNTTLAIADTGNNRIREVTGLGASPIINTVAGTGTQNYYGDGGLASKAGLSNPNGVVEDAAGNIYIADATNNAIRRVDALTGIITTVAGNGQIPYALPVAGQPATSQPVTPQSLAFDASGNLYFATQGTIAELQAGSGALALLPGNPPVSGASFALDGKGNLYSTVNNQVIEIALATGAVTLIANSSGAAGFSGDGAAATAAELDLPTGVALDGNGNLYVADSGNFRVRVINLGSGIIATFAGNGTKGDTGDGGAATAAEIGYAANISTNSAGDVLFPDEEYFVVRKITAATGVISTVAGTGVIGYNGDALAATATNLAPAGVYQDGAGNLVVADDGSELVWIFAEKPIALTPALTASTAAIIYGQSATLSFSLSGPIFGVVPAGSVQFMANGAAIATVKLTNGAASYMVSGAVLPPGAYTLTALYSGDTNYEAVSSAPVSFAVGKAVPIINWQAPASIPYGTPLSATQLNATASGANGTLPGTFTYKPAAATVLPVGNNPLEVTFAPTDSTDYAGATAMTTISVTLETPSGTTFSGPSSVEAAGQVGLSFDLTNPYPLELTVTLALSLSGTAVGANPGPGLPQFANGQPAYSFTIPANSTGPSTIQLATGTQDGTLTVTPDVVITSTGQDVTPPDLAAVDINIPTLPPVITSMTLTRNGDTITASIMGYSDTRDMTEINFTLTTSKGNNIDDPNITVPAQTLFSNYYTSQESQPYGSEFLYTQRFNLTADNSIVEQIGVTLTNSAGNSATAVAQ